MSKLMESMVKKEKFIKNLDTLITLKNIYPRN